MSGFTFWHEHEVANLNASEFRVWKSQAGSRLIKFASGVCLRAREEIPSIQITMPPDLRPDLAPHVHHAHVSWDLLCSIVQQIPKHCTLPADATPVQRRAWRVLETLREAVMAARGLPVEQALSVIEAALALGVAASRAHVEPYQSKVDGKLKQEERLINLNRDANYARFIDGSERQALWQSAADRIWRAHPAWSASQVARCIALDESLPGSNFNTIRRKIRKKPN